MVERRFRLKRVPALEIIKEVVMIGMSVFMLCPLIWSFLTALMPRELVSTYPPVFFSKRFSLNNFTYMFNSSNELVLFRNSFFYSLTSAVISVIFASMSAYVLTRVRFKGKGLVTILILCPMLIPGLTNMIPLYMVYSKLGLINTFTGLILLYLPGLLPLPIVILRTYMSAIPITVEEAASIDGCSRLQVLFKIVLPILSPGILAVVLINFITVWNDFIITLIFTSTDHMKTLTLGLYTILYDGTIHKGIVSATAIMDLLPVLILFLFCRKRFISAMLDGAVKG